MMSNDESDRGESSGDSDGHSEDSVDTAATRTTGKRKQTHPVDSDSDIESESHSKRHQTANPSDLQAIAEQLLQSRSLI